MEFQPRESNGKVRMTNPQIVNGSQTSYALFEASRPDPSLIRHVKLLVGIIETADRSFTNSVAEATNSQTPIRSRDIRSNDHIQIKLENSLLGYGYYYERKNDQHIAQKSDVRIDSVKLGQVILSYILREPDRAKTASNKIFGEYYEWIFDEFILSAENVVAMWKIYKMVDDDRRKALASLNSRTSRPYEEDWIIEGVFHILFMLGQQCEIKGLDRFDPSAVENEYQEVKAILDEFMQKNGNQASYRVFRSAHTKRLLARDITSKQLALPF